MPRTVLPVQALVAAKDAEQLAEELHAAKARVNEVDHENVRSA